MSWALSSASFVGLFWVIFLYNCTQHSSIRVGLEVRRKKEKKKKNYLTTYVLAASRVYVIRSERKKNTSQEL